MSQDDKVTSESGESESEADTAPIDPALLLMDRIETQFEKLAEILRLHDERLGALETLQQLAARDSAEPEATPTESSAVGTPAAQPKAREPVEAPSPQPRQEAAKPEAEAPAEPPAKPTGVGAWWKQHIFPNK